MIISVELKNILEKIIKVDLEGTLKISDLNVFILEEYNLKITSFKLLSSLEMFLNVRNIKYSRQSLALGDIVFKGITIIKPKKQDRFFKLWFSLFLLLLGIIFVKSVVSNNKLKFINISHNLNSIKFIDKTDSNLNKLKSESKIYKLKSQITKKKVSYLVLAGFTTYMVYKCFKHFFSPKLSYTPYILPSRSEKNIKQVILQDNVQQMISQSSYSEQSISEHSERTVVELTSEHSERTAVELTFPSVIDLTLSENNDPTSPLVIDLTLSEKSVTSPSTYISDNVESLSSQTPTDIPSVFQQDNVVFSPDPTPSIKYHLTRYREEADRNVKNLSKIFEDS